MAFIKALKNNFEDALMMLHIAGLLLHPIHSTT